MMNGEIAPMIRVTLSTSSMPVNATRTTMSSDPTHRGRSNCCLRFAPAPANMTNPVLNSVTITATSRILDMIGEEMRSNTAVCSPARK